MMPKETKEAVEWAKKQCVEVEGHKFYVENDGDINHHLLVDFTSEYFNSNNIKYSTFNYNSLRPYL